MGALSPTWTVPSCIKNNTTKVNMGGDTHQVKWGETRTALRLLGTWGVKGLIRWKGQKKKIAPPGMTAAKVLYQLLRVEPTADAAEIRKQYLILSKKLHPDKSDVRARAPSNLPRAGGRQKGLAPSERARARRSSAGPRRREALHRAQEGLRGAQGSGATRAVRPHRLR